MDGKGSKLGRLDLVPGRATEQPDAAPRREARVVWVSAPSAAAKPVESRRFDLKSPELISRLGVELIVEEFVLNGDASSKSPGVRNALLDVTVIKFGNVLTHFLPELNDLAERLGQEGGANFGLSVWDVLKDEGMRDDTECLMIELRRDDGTKNTRILPLGPKVLEALKAYRMLGDGVFRRAVAPSSQRIGDALQYLVPEGIKPEVYGDVSVPVAYSPKYAASRLDYDYLAWRSLKPERGADPQLGSGEVPLTITSRIVSKASLKESMKA